jgi:hypothetical protein
MGWPKKKDRNYGTELHSQPAVDMLSTAKMHIFQGLFSKHANVLV